MHCGAYAVPTTTAVMYISVCMKPVLSSVLLHDVRKESGPLARDICYNNAGPPFMYHLLGHAATHKTYDDRFLILQLPQPVQLITGLLQNI